MFAQIIDANINRASEGLRVIEEYCRFVAKKKEQTLTLSKIRKAINASEPHPIENLNIRATESDMRAKETPTKRQETYDVLKANFKRVEEALRVLEEYTGHAQYSYWRYDLYDLEKDILLTLCKPVLKKGIYVISDDPDILKTALKDGASIIQLRDKNNAKEMMFNKSKIIVPLAKKAGIPIILNDYLDLVQLTDADGLHSGQDDIDIGAQRQLLGPHKLIGRTTHNLEQGLAAQKQGADYISIGPIWDTPSKPNREGIGLNYLEKAPEHITIPYVAIGGIDMKRAEIIASYQPPMIGIIRAVTDIKKLVKLIA